MRDAARGEAAAARRAAPRRALADKVRMALGVAQGMQALEAAQPPILHRDLKPRRARPLGASASPATSRRLRQPGVPLRRAQAPSLRVWRPCSPSVQAWRCLPGGARISDAGLPARLPPGAGMKGMPHVCFRATASGWL